MNERLEQCSLIKFEGSEITIGNHVYILGQLFSEKVNRDLGERRAVFYANRAKDGMEAVVKLRFQLHSMWLYEPEEYAHRIEWSKRIFRDEIRALRLLEPLRETPTLYDYGVLEQDDRHDYPGGFINAIAMSRMPGKPATDYPDLSDVEGEGLKRKVLQILQDIRLLGWELYDGEPDNIVYDRLTGTVSITCIAYGADKPTDRPITERDGFLRILGQNLWWT
ncbi:hypothetical protein BDV41DRAFT_589430 [Aspergillus transmontanensis]|uniref:Protein kinase domain-containing protein n=1 Tax=Aspergillus transmontanensis TaxID=1034304 RepID=A0A5N6VSV5_9EURO|nr:hypothetical protein BDV41DRAFT_589430 [Aspergillus transmontanensis]